MRRALGAPGAGGYLEARVKLPGDNFHTGFWPALWTMGNLGRAGYMASTTGEGPGGA